MHMYNRNHLLLFFLASSFGLILSFKGFAGFDLSPIISLASGLNNGMGFHDFITNPFPPGFAFLLKIAAYPFNQISYQWFFGINILLSFLLFTIFIYFSNKLKVSYKYLEYGLLLALLIPIITDGHIYLHDISNSFASTVLALTFIYINHFEPHRKHESTLLYVILFLSSFLLFLRPNTGISFSLIVLFTLFTHSFFLSFNWKQLLIYFFKGLFIFSLATLLWLFTFKLFLSFNIEEYIQTLKLISKTRGGLDHGLLIFNLLDPWAQSKNKYLANLLYFSQLLSLLLIFVSSHQYIRKIDCNKYLVFLICLLGISFYSSKYWQSFPYLFMVSYLIFLFLNIRNTEFFNISDKVKRIPIFIMIFFSFVFGFIILMQGYDVRSSSFGVLIIPISMMVFTEKLDQSFFQNKQRMKFWLKIFLLLLIFEGGYRFKLVLAGPPIDKDDYNVSLNNSFFYKLSTSKGHAKFDKGVSDFIDSNQEIISGEKSVLFLARIEYLYAQYNIQPPAGLPLWWHRNTSYHESDNNKINETILNAVDYVIALNYNGTPDVGLMDNELLLQTFTNGKYFEKDTSFEGIIIYRRKGKNV